MHVKANHDRNVYIITPTDSDEVNVLTEVAAKTNVGEDLQYEGRSSDDPQGKFSRVHLKAGSDKAAYPFVLQGTDEIDKYTINGIRNSCFFGSGKLIVVSIQNSGSDITLEVTSSTCKVCGKPIIDLSQVEWRVCHECAEKCNHTYERGMIHGSAGLGIGEYCTICGRAKPDPERDKKSRIEREVEVEKELGVQVVDKETLLTASERQRLMRKDD